MVPPAQSVQLLAIVPGMVPLFSQAPVSAIGICGNRYGSECFSGSTIQSCWQCWQREHCRRCRRYGDGSGLRERVVTIIETSISNGDGTTSTERPVVGDRTRDGTTVLTRTRRAIGICGIRYGSVCLQLQHNPKLLAVLAT